MLKNQKIGIDSKLTAELSPGKAYIKGFEHETVTTTLVNLNKARDTEAVTAEKQGVEFGPYLKVTDVIANTTFTRIAGTGTPIMLNILPLTDDQWMLVSTSDSGPQSGTGNLFARVLNVSGTGVANDGATGGKQGCGTAWAKVPASGPCLEPRVYGDLE